MLKIVDTKQTCGPADTFLHFVVSEGGSLGIFCDFAGGPRIYIYMSASQGYFEENAQFASVFFRRCEDPSRTTCEGSGAAVALAQVFSWAKTDRHSNDDAKCFRYKKNIQVEWPGKCLVWMIDVKDFF